LARDALTEELLDAAANTLLIDWKEQAPVDWRRTRQAPERWRPLNALATHRRKGATDRRTLTWWSW